MKRMFVWLLVAALALSCLAGCSQNEAQPEAEEDDETFLGESIEDAQPYPRSDAGYVGDPMPFFDDGVFHVFYLLDTRTGNGGYHPWALYNTTDFCTFEDVGEVLPFATEGTAQDLALGTGCVIKGQDGQYHAFYTGHNDTFSPKEAVMHATSGDLLSWTKCPEDTLYAGEAYSQDDFRDPYVLWVPEENQYWMLVTTRNGQTGIIVRYTSTDLKTWTDEGVFFVNDMGTDSNMECPSLLFFNGKWYLSFSDQWPNRYFHYRVSDAIDGPFSIPEQDVIDGNGFYAGRLETDGESLYAFGWNGMKVGHDDSADYDWGGNLVVHQLAQREDGSLVPVPNEKLAAGMNHELKLNPLRMTESVKRDGNSYQCAGKEYEAVEFKDILGSYLFKTTVKNFADAERFGIAFATDDEAVGALNLVLDVKNGSIAFYNTSAMYSADPQSELPFDFSGLEELALTVTICNGVVSLNVNGTCAMTARMYASQGGTWGLFAANSPVVFEDVSLYK